MKSLLSLFSLVIIVLVTNPLVAKTDDFDTVKQRVIKELKKTQVEDSSIKSIVSLLNNDGSFEDINYDDLSRTAGFPQRRHTSRLVELALAYNQKSSVYFKNKLLLEDIKKGLKFWNDNDFFGDNWHNNQISTPTNLVNLMLLIGDKLPSDLVENAQPIIGRANMKASGARPSGDRIVIAGIRAKNLLFRNDKNEFDKIIKIIEGELKFNTGKRGMQHDYSFHHRTDRVNNTTSYGYGKYANAYGEWSYYVAGTKYQFSIDKINQLVDYYLDGICKQLVYGIYEDVSVKNRAITHKAEFTPRGLLEIERLLFVTDYRKDELEEIMRLRKGEAQPTQSFAKFFWQTEHFVFQRPGFYTTVRMFSSRNRNMEMPYNGPGKPTHHRADGTNYLQLKGNEYLNIWPVYDWQKISGATIVQKPELYPPSEIQKEGLTDFVGAVCDGMYGAVAFDFLSPHDFVKAKKSWFFFDDKYVCLGTGISCRKDLPVATTINQVLLKSDVFVSENTGAKKLEKGDRQLENVNWVYHDKIAYIFPEPTTINLSNQTETGRWSDITDEKNASTELIKKDVFTLWYNHGNRPQNSSYQYIVVPNIQLNKVKDTAETNGEISVLSNTTSLQAVKNKKTGMYQFVFYSSGEIEMMPGKTFKMYSQGMAMLKTEKNKIIEITVADPSRKLKKIMISIPGKAELQKDVATTIYNSNENSTLLLIDLPQGVYSGKSATIKL